MAKPDEIDPDEIDSDEIEALQLERAELHKEILRLRDLVVGRDAELATALGRIEELEAMLGRYVHMEQRLNSVLESRTWRIAHTVSTPLRVLRGRGG